MIDHVGLARDANRDRDNYIMENLEDLFFTKCLLDYKVKKIKLWVGVMSNNDRVKKYSNTITILNFKIRVLY
jgi:hypothetical protein